MVLHSLRNKLISEVPLTFASYPFFVWLGISKDLPLRTRRRPFWERWYSAFW